MASNHSRNAHPELHQGSVVAGQLPADQSLHRQTMVDQGHRTAARAGQRECYQVTIQFPFNIIERLWGILNVTVDIVMKSCTNEMKDYSTNITIHMYIIH